VKPAKNIGKLVAAARAGLKTGGDTVKEAAATETA